MNLSFKTHIDGEPTYFVEKIWAGFTDPIFRLMDFPVWQSHLTSCVRYGNINLEMLRLFQKTGLRKITTIRADEKNRWREDMDIHMVINNRTPNRFQFAPLVKVKSIQKIEIKHRRKVGVFEVCIDGRVFSRYDLELELYLNKSGLSLLARQDGFDSIRDFMAFFPDDFSGKIIHWTDEHYKPIFQ